MSCYVNESNIWSIIYNRQFPPCSQYLAVKNKQELSIGKGNDPVRKVFAASSPTLKKRIGQKLTPNDNAMLFLCLYIYTLTHHSATTSNCF